MISLIVPCYNEQESLPIFYEEVTKVVSGMGEDYELVLVNDGSKDKTLEVMRQHPDLADIPVVFLTGIFEREHIMSVLQLNPAGYLLKPTEQEKLIDTIEKALRKHGGSKN